MHKIAFSGIPGSGKTSVLGEVRKLLALKYRVEEVPDLKPGSPFDFNQWAGFVGTFYFITTQINEENIRSQGRPDFLLCDRSLLDHWLEWQLSQAERPGHTVAERDALLEKLYRFWMPSYATVFRIRAEARVLKERLAKSSPPNDAAERARRMDDVYTRAIQKDRISVFDIWNQQSIDESTQEAMVHLADMKLI